MIKLGQKPLIALPVKDENLDSTLKVAKEMEIDIIELRVDQFSSLEIDHIRSCLNKVKEYGMATLLTVRAGWEGGARDIPDRERLDIIKNTVDLSDIVDIEYRAEIRDEVINFVKSNHRMALVSHHDFEKTPPASSVQEYIDSAAKLGADIIKFAYKASSFQDVADVLCVTGRNKDKNIVAILMGETGKISRVAGFVFGSVITYTYIGQAFAPGQIEAEKLLQELKFYGLR